ncbi:hypothetical protein CCR75_008218 [Bremia lactucae]|uniref:Transcription initiation factor IIE subunit alpha N-terminal domain-containing protein n=1 Tax=Bremia lactucae TaxID=4779 RepID=A0A976FNL4_BRELC|nr:hypothetical protein CCR75_008218 [Bremia lactucae]
MREKFMKDDEMGNAVNLQTRQVRKIMNELHQDHLVCEEVLNDKRAGGSSSTSYWYIDYKYFVDVIQYRLYVMHEHLKDSEQLEIERQTFQCSDPECGREYTALEAQLLLLPGQYQFRCGHCNAILLECDNNDRLVRIQSLQRKFKDQMNKQQGMHDGIYEVLRRIGDFVKQGQVLPTNLPSDNRAAGLGGQHTRTQAGAGSGSRGRHGNTGVGARGDDRNLTSFLYPYGTQEQEIIVDIASTSTVEDEYLNSRDRHKETETATQPLAAPRALPAFLQGSSISGHMAAKHAVETQSGKDLMRETTSSSTDTLLVQSEMTEEERQEAFKRAYMAELERYNGETDENEVQIQVETQGSWETDMNIDAMEDDELEEIEWEWCVDDNSETNGCRDATILVNGECKRLDGVDDHDLLTMTEDEFLSCYRMCLAENDVIG